jgi:hypothetical protein
MDSSASRIVRAVMSAGEVLEYLVTVVKPRDQNLGDYVKDTVTPRTGIPPRTVSRWRAFYAKHKEEEPDQWPKTLTQYDRIAAGHVLAEQLEETRDENVAHINKYLGVLTAKDSSFFDRYKRMTGERLGQLDTADKRRLTAPQQKGGQQWPAGPRGALGAAGSGATGGHHQGR